MTRWAAWLLGAIGVAVAAALVAAARPAAIAALLARSQPLPMGLALLISALVLVLRGFRLALLASPRLPAARAIAIQGVTTAAVALLPLRTGELALVPLLRAAGVPGTLRGLSFLVSLRLLDIAGLLVWVALAAAALGGRYGWAVLPLAAVPALAAGAVLVGLRILRRVAGGWRRRGGIRRAALRQLLQVRRELRAAVRSPRRAGLVLAVSVAIWAGVWWLTVALVRGMGLAWPASAVLLGVVGASVGAALPINALGNFGTLEAGWTAALSALGIPAGEALAAGFATHLWSALFTAILGAGCGAYLWLAAGRTAAR